MPLLEVRAGLITARATRGEDFDAFLTAVKAVPGRAFNAAERYWYWPATQSHAQTLMLAFPSQPAVGTAFMELLAPQPQAPLEALPPIPMVKTQPWAHQLRAYHFALNKRAAYLAMAMRTGKTKVVADLVVNRSHRCVLVVAPANVVDVWPYQFDLHAGAPVQVTPLGTGSSVKNAKLGGDAIARAAAAGVPAVLVTNHEAAAMAPFMEWAVKQPWDLLVLDEIHRFKAAGGRRSWAMARLGQRIPWRIGLSGTPMPHDFTDSYAQYRILDNSIFGTSMVRFRAEYAQMEQVPGVSTAWRVKGCLKPVEFTRKLYQIMLRVGEEVLDLPVATTNVRFFDLDTEERRVYQELEQHFYSQVGNGAVAPVSAGVRLLRLLQVAGGFVPVQESVDGTVTQTPHQLGTSKAQALADLLSDIDPAEPVVIFAHFLHDLDVIRRVCEQQGRTCAELSSRRRELKPWQDGQFNVLASQIHAGSVGIEAARARYCIYYSLNHSLEDWEQSTKRVRGPAQKQAVAYYYLLGRNTAEPRVLWALQHRRDVIEALLATRGQAQPEARQLVLAQT